MQNPKEYLVGAILLLLLSVRYYPGYPERTLLESVKFLLAVLLYGLGFAFLCQWVAKKFLKKDLPRTAFFKIALWAAVIMALGESLEHYFRPY